MPKRLHPSESPITVAVVTRRCGGRVFYTGLLTVHVEMRGEIELRTDYTMDEEHARACLVDLARALGRAREVATELSELPYAPTKRERDELPSGRRAARCQTRPIGPPNPRIKHSSADDA
jgi:hypothetical protein